MMDPGRTDGPHGSGSLGRCRRGADGSRDGDEAYLAYHDEEWGVPVHDERRLFEMLTLEGAQAGLSWSTILRKRDGYRAAFAGFDPEAVARFTPARIERLLADPSIVRNRAKVTSTVANAAAVLRIREERGRSTTSCGRSSAASRSCIGTAASGTSPLRRPSRERCRRNSNDAASASSVPTVCYAFMQACGLVNDHVTSCFRWTELGGS